MTDNMIINTATLTVIAFSGYYAGQLSLVLKIDKLTEKKQEHEKKLFSQILKQILESILALFSVVVSFIFCYFMFAV